MREEDKGKQKAKGVSSKSPPVVQPTVSWRKCSSGAVEQDLIPSVSLIAKFEFVKSTLIYFQYVNICRDDWHL